jgi:hypothetical protein
VIHCGVSVRVPTVDAVGEVRLGDDHPPSRARRRLRWCLGEIRKSPARSGASVFSPDTGLVVAPPSGQLISATMVPGLSPLEGAAGRD